jgi:hypothetical protein
MDEGVRVSVIESGFARLDTTDERRAQSIESNSGGWDAEMSSLRNRAES